MGNSFINRIVYLEKKRRRRRYFRKVVAGLRQFGEIKLNLTAAEKREAQAYWGRIDKHFDMRWMALYKALSGSFDVRNMPEDIWNICQNRLNPPLLRHTLQHKVLLYNILPPNLLPNPVGALIGVSFLDATFNPIDIRSFATQLVQHDEVFCKPASASHSGGGKGVSVWEPSALGFDEVLRKLEDLQSKEKDIIFQLPIVNHPFYASFSPKALSTLRLFTLNLNGKVSYCSTYFRNALTDTRVDNAGSGGIMIPVQSDGVLREYGYTSLRTHFHRESSTGIVYKGLELYEFQRMKECCIQEHKKLPYVGFVAWDVTLDIDNNVRLVELNLDGQEVFDYQSNNGPLFGERTEEVVNYILNHPIKRVYTF